MNTSLGSNCPGSPNAFDSDLAGIGFIVYFYTNSLVAIFAVLAAYLMGALPDIEYKEVDILLIGFLRRWSPWRFSRFKTKQALRRGRRFEPCFEKFLVTLADQQLAISLAILIAVCSKWDQISLYSLEIAWTLATTSLVTHMTAIRYCPKYIRASPLLGTVRAASIFVVLTGFISLMIILDYAELRALQLAVDVDGQSAASVAWRMQVSCIFSQPIQKPACLVKDIFWCAAAVIYYLNILTKLKSPNGEIHAFSFFYRGLVHLFRGKPADFDDYRHIYKSRKTWIENVKPRPLLKVLCERLAEMEAAYLAIKTSVSVDIPWLFFVLIYCLAQLRTVWLDSDSLLWDPTTHSASLGVGQIIALILLMGPLFTGVDSFIGAAPTDIETALAAVDDTEDTEATLAAVNDTQDTEAAPAAVNDIEAARAQQDLDAVLKEHWFQNFLYILSGWNMAVLVYAGIICGGPLDSIGINMSVTCLIATLFVWEVVLELRNLIMRILVKFRKH